MSRIAASPQRITVTQSLKLRCTQSACSAAAARFYALLTLWLPNTVHLSCVVGVETLLHCALCVHLLLAAANRIMWGAANLKSPAEARVGCRKPVRTINKSCSATAALLLGCALALQFTQQNLAVAAQGVLICARRWCLLWRCRFIVM
jgi:hypothetical protein